MRQDHHAPRRRPAPRMPPPRLALRGLAGRMAAVTAAAALLVWPAFMNGYPILFIATWC